MIIDPHTPDRTAQIAAIRELPERAVVAVMDLTDEQLDTPYRNGGWNVRQVIHHIADSHINGYARMKMILTEENPTLKPYDQDLWSELVDVTSLPIDSSMAMLHGLHARWATFLDSLREEDFLRTGYHPEIGNVTLGFMLEDYAEHGDHHLEQIRDLRKRMGW